MESTIMIEPKILKWCLNKCAKSPDRLFKLLRSKYEFRGSEPWTSVETRRLKYAAVEADFDPARTIKILNHAEQSSDALPARKD